MLRKSKDAYTNRTPRKRWQAVADRLRQIGVALPSEARPFTPGDEVYGPGSDDQKCVEESGSPGSLTERDILLIRDQAHLQRATSPEQLQGLLDAWNAAKQTVFNQPEVTSDPQAMETFALQLAKTIEPQHNSGGWRLVPARFGGAEQMKQALSPKLVLQAMSQLFRAYAERWLEPDEWYKEYQSVHPLYDGNGRLGDLLWKMDHVRRGNPWPDTHPPDFFGTDRSEFSAPSVDETNDEAEPAEEPARSRVRF